MKSPKPLPSSVRRFRAAFAVAVAAALVTALAATAAQRARAPEAPPRPAFAPLEAHWTRLPPRVDVERMYPRPASRR